MTVSSTRCCARPATALPERWRWSTLARAIVISALLALAGLLAPWTARAESTPAEVTQLRADRSDDGVYLAAALRFELSPVVEDALLKGIPMIFTAEAEIYRHRWYWTNRRVTSATRQYRLSYQPLTRRWRLSTLSAGATPGLGSNLAQQFDTLTEAMGVLQRIPRWKIAEAADIEPDTRHEVEFRFRLDVTQLPRPFQLGALGSADWTIVASRSVRMAEGAPR